MSLGQFLIHQRPPFRDVRHGLDGPLQVELPARPARCRPGPASARRDQRRQDHGHAFVFDIIEDPECQHRATHRPTVPEFWHSSLGSADLNLAVVSAV